MSWPTPSSLGERSRRPIHTAACLIIGDEVLGGKTVDTNSAYFAKWCFLLGIVSCAYFGEGIRRWNVRRSGVTVVEFGNVERE